VEKEEEKRDLQLFLFGRARSRVDEMLVALVVI